MPGRNEPCPCGSGRKYKKCCLDRDQRISRQKAVLEETFAAFKQAAGKVERQAVREVGIEAMDRWAEPFIEDLELEAHTFQEFSLCHIPFQGASNLWEWAESRISLEPREREALDIAAGTPYSYWELSAVTGEGTFVLRDLLTQTVRSVLPIEDLVSDVGHVFYGKVIRWEDQFQLLSYNPVFMVPEAAQTVVERALGDKQSLTTEQLLEPDKSAQLYLGWWDEVRRRMKPDEPSQLLPKLTCSYDPRTEAWLSQALTNSPDFAAQSKSHFSYPGTGKPQALITLEGGTLQANLLEPRVEAVEAAIYRAGGALLFLDSMSGPAEEEFGHWGPSIQEVLDDFLDDRAATVSESTLRRDRRAVELLSLYLVRIQGDLDFCQDPEEYLAQSDFQDILSAIPGFAEFLPNCRLVKSRSKAKGFATSIKLLVKWMAEAELLEAQEKEGLVEVLEAGGPPKGPQTYLLRLTLVGSEPPVWRDIKIPGRYSLNRVHRMFQVLFGWQDYHLHDFQFGKRLFTDLDTLDPEFEMGEEDEKIALCQALGWRKSFLYRYDFGDSWEIQAQVLKRIESDRDAPECTDGAQSGPPEDCGGIPGFEELKRILADPKHPDYEEMRTWAPRGYDPSQFSAQSMTKKLVRQFGRKPKKPKAPETSELAGFRLSKMNVLAAIVAALKEESPRTIEQVHQRLTELDYPLKAGLESLRRALAKAEYVRTRLDGALELVPGEALRHALFWMQYKSEEGLTTEKREVQVSQPAGPVSREELNQARPNGTFPRTMSFRRKLILVLEAIGGEATVDNTLELLGEMLDGRVSGGVTEALRTLKGTSAVEIQGHTLKLVIGSSDLLKAREALRKWTLPLLKAEAERARWKEKAEARKLERFQETRTEREHLSALVRVVVAGHWSPDNFCLGLRWVDNAEVDWFIDPRQALEAVSKAGVVIGLDPRTGFERMGWELPEMLVVDLTPSFKSIPTAHGRRRPLSTSKAIAFVTGRGVSDEKQIAGWAAQGRDEKLREALESDLEQLCSYWRYGLIHGAVLRGHEWMPVNWNVCKEIVLHDAVKWCLEDQLPLKLRVKDGTEGDFRPREVEWRAIYDEDNILHGTWERDGRRAVFPFNQIMDCEYPYEPSRERLERVIW